ncbi:MAG: GNAT family N-acetyltransferase [Pseudonocardiaceae bacterium]
MVLGERVKLRPMEPSDAETLWRWDHDPDVMRWMDDGYAQPLAQVKKLMEEWPRNAYGDVLFGIEVLTDTKLIGLVRLHDAEPEIGCCVTRDCRRRADASPWRSRPGLAASSRE